MKLSRYNSYISLGDKAGLIYNAFSDSFITVKSSSDDFEKILKSDLQSISPLLIQQMKDAGALISEEIDEAEAVKNRIESVDNDDSFLYIHINPTLDCNFRCWYCYENHVKDSCMSPDTIRNIVKLIEDRIEKQQNLKLIHLSFFGGEPLLRFNEVVKPLISKISAICTGHEIRLSVHFTSNSFLLDDEMISFLKEYNSGFQITLDGGRENHNRTRFGKGGIPSFDGILENVKKLALSKIPVGLRINYTRDNIDSTEEIINIISEWPDEAKKIIAVDYQRVWQDRSPRSNDPVYDKARIFRKRLRNAGYLVRNNRIINGVANSCYGDKRNQLLVNYNGDVFCCTARDFKSENRLGYLDENGQVVWEGDGFEKRMSLKFSKPACHRCRIAPICGGGCRTQAVEHIDSDPEKCMYSYSDELIDEYIIERFEERYMQDK